MRTVQIDANKYPGERLLNIGTYLAFTWHTTSPLELGDIFEYGSPPFPLGIYRAVETSHDPITGRNTVKALPVTRPTRNGLVTQVAARRYVVREVRGLLADLFPEEQPAEKVHQWVEMMQALSHKAVLEAMKKQLQSAGLDGSIVDSDIQKWEERLESTATTLRILEGRGLE